jgi:hypothetical protein
MAFENTHIYLADVIMQQLRENDLKTILDHHIGQYYLGSVFPDVLFYGRDKAVSQTAHMLHGNDGLPTNRLVFDILDRIRPLGDHKNFAFVAGYLTHLAVDTTLHPVVYYISGFKSVENRKERNRSAYLHWHYETCIDRAVNRKFYLDEILHPGLLDGLLVEKVTGVNLKLITQALRRQVAYFAMTRKRRYFHLFRLLSRIGIVPPESVAGFYDNLNKEKECLPDPIAYRDVIDGTSKQTTLDRLIANAVDLGVDMITAAADYYSDRITRQDCEKTIAGYNLATGWPGKTKDDIRFSSTYPL